MKFIRTMAQFMNSLPCWRLTHWAPALAILILACPSQAKAQNMTVYGIVGEQWSDIVYAQSDSDDWYYWVYEAQSGWYPCAGYDSEHFLHFSDGWLYGVTSGVYFSLNGGTGGWGGPDGTHPSTWDREGEYPNNGPDQDSSAVLLDGDGWETIVVDTVSYEYDAYTDIWYLYDSESGGYLDVADPNS